MDVGVQRRPMRTHINKNPGSSLLFSITLNMLVDILRAAVSWHKGAAVCEGRKKPESHSPPQGELVGFFLKKKKKLFQRPQLVTSVISLCVISLMLVT